LAKLFKHPSPYLLSCCIALSNESIVLPEEAKTILKTALHGFLGGKSLEQFARDQFEKHATQPSYVVMSK
jgi:hypothetical protein